MHILLECVCFSAQANEKNAFFASHFFYKCIVYFQNILYICKKSVRTQSVRISDIVIINLILYFRNWGGWFNLHMETYRTWQVVLGPPPHRFCVSQKHQFWSFWAFCIHVGYIVCSCVLRIFAKGGKIWNCARSARYFFPLPPWGGGTSTAKQKLLRKFKLFSVCKW